MAPQTSLAVGIDLATTYSVIAYLDPAGRPVTVVNAEGGLTTPSVVLFDGETVIVGEEAVMAMGAEADKVAACAKRDMGKRAYHATVGGQQYPPEVIQAYILRKLRNDLARHIGPFQQVVITVPAYFDETRRKATQDAGYIAGLEVIDIINEPTAAALTYAHGKMLLTGQKLGSKEKPPKYLVYDLGGGTFDVSIVETDGETFRVLATDGDVQLGGQDWDYRLVDHVAQQFVQQHQADPRTDLQSLARLWRNCELAKRSLSARQEATVTCEFAGKSLRLKITRQLFEDLTADLLERTNTTTRLAVREAGLEWSDIEQVLLVGGSCKMPMVQQMLATLAGKSPDASLSAEEAVAHGAALHAGILMARSQGQPPKFHVTNVNSHSLGIVGTDPQTKLKRNCILIRRNSPLPAEAKSIFRTAIENQPNIRVDLVEGESPSPDGCIALGTCVVRDLPPKLPAQTPILVHLTYAPNGRLGIDIRVQNTNNRLQHELIRQNSLSQTDLDAWRDFVTTTPGM